MRDPRIDPQAGDVVHFREKPARRVTERFVDACGTPCVVYTTSHVVKVKTWQDAVAGVYDIDRAPEPK